jgi:hypothetical protein
MSKVRYEAARYLNVDLELESSSSMENLLGHLSEQAVVLHHAKQGRSWVACLELLSQRPRNADQAILSFVELLAGLPSAQRRQWDAAKLRTFNIGARAGLDGAPLELKVGPATLEAVAALGAGLAITVYDPAKPTRKEVARRRK